MIRLLMFRPALRNIVSQLATGRKSSVASALLVTLIMCSIFPADASIVTLRVRPSQLKDNTYEQIEVTLNNSDGDYYSFKRIFCTANYSIGDAAVGCEIFENCKIEGNVWNYRKIFADNRLSNRIIIGRDKDPNYNSGSLNFTLTDSGITSHYGKWKINGIDLYVWNINAEENQRNPNTGNIYPSRLTVNGKKFTLEESKELKLLRVDFAGDEQWISNIELKADFGDNVGISRIVLHIDDVNGFNTIDTTAGRLDYNSNENAYNIPSVLFGGKCDFKDKTRLVILDSEGKVLQNVNTENKEDTDKDNPGYRYFKISAPEGTLTEGKYYACYYVDVDDTQSERQIPDARTSDGIPFEIVPVVDHLALNWGALVPAGNNQYTCSVPPEITQTLDDGTSITWGWKNALISGHLPGTAVYWKILKNQDEADNLIKSAATQSARSTVRRALASIPEGFQRLTGAGVDLSGGNNLKKGILGIVLARNGVISDPKVIHYTYYEDFPTNVSDIVSETTPETVWYTFDGIRVNPDRCPSGTPLIRIDRYPDGRTVSSKINFYRK